MSDVIEKMAERFYDHDCYNSATCDMPADWEFFAQDNINRDRVARYRLSAQAALTILEQEGWQRVPEGSDKHAKAVEAVAAQLSVERIQGWSNPLVVSLMDAVKFLRNEPESQDAGAAMISAGEEG